MPGIGRRNSERAAPAWVAVGITALGLAIGDLSAAVSIPLGQVLAEAETAIRDRRPADAAPLLDLVLDRVAAGEALPGGARPERIKLAAATVHFQGGSPDRAQTLAEELSRSASTPLFAAEARMIVGLGLARRERFAEAVPVFAALEESAAHRDRARLYGAMAAQQAGQIPAAIATYRRLLTSAPRDAEWADAALALVSLLIQQKEPEEAERGLALLRGRRDLVDNLAGLNALGLQLGDALLEAGDPARALAAYRFALPLKDLIASQEARLAEIRQRIERGRAAARGLGGDLDVLRRWEQRREQTEAALRAAQGLTGYDGALRMRIARAYQQLGRPWEAAIAYAEALADPTATSTHALARAGLVGAWAEAGRTARTLAALDDLAKAHPGDPLVAQALYTAVLAAQAREAKDLLTPLLDRVDALAAGSPHREPLLIVHTQILLAAGQHAEARTRAETYLHEFPRGSFEEAADYLRIMAGLMLGQPRRAIAELQAHQQRWPAGRFAADAGYRLASAYHAVEEAGPALRTIEAWLRDQPSDHPQRGEVLALRGDVQATEDVPAAISSYREALAYPLEDGLLGYVLDELTKHHQARREFGAAVTMWETFARNRPDHPYVINAAYWIGRIRIREGRREEGLAQVAEIAARYLDDPARDGVERLLSELAGMSAAPRAAVADASASADPTEGDAALLVRLRGERTDETLSPTARARLAFFASEQAARRGQEVTASERLLRLVTEVPRDALPPGILGRLGDALRLAERWTEAEPCYRRIVAAYPRSEFADFGYVGLGEVAMQQGKPDEALEQFSAAIDRAGARFKLREATIGRARALLALGRLDAARELFEQVAGTREWRGELTAESVWSLGEILRQRGGREQLAQAQAHFQRVYLSYRRYPVWVARAYLCSAETFRELGQNPEAAATLREMLRDDKLAIRAEAAEARRRLAEWEGSTL